MDVNCSPKRIAVKRKTITVTCQEHHKVLIDGFYDYFNKKREVDLKLSCHKQTIEAHRMILELFLPTLISGSPLMLPESEEGKQGKMRTVDLGHATQRFQDLEAIVEFVYRGEVSFSRSRLKPILETARSLDFKLLIDAIERGRPGIVEMKDDISDVKYVTKKDKGTPSNGNRGCGNRRKRNGSPAKLMASTKKSPLAVEVKPRGRPLKVEPPPIQTRSGEVRRGTSRRISDTDIVKEIDSNYDSEMEDDNDDRLEESLQMDNHCSSDSEESANLQQLDCSESAGVVRRIPRVTKVGNWRVLLKGDKGTMSRAEYKKMWRKNRPVQKCGHCAYETRDKFRYKVHQAKHDPTVVIFKCEACGVSFQSKDTLDRHVMTHQGAQEVFYCSQCSYSSPKKINYHRHITAIHKIASDGKPLEEKYKCGECDFMCMYKGQYTLHFKMKHSSEKPFKCESCSYASIRKGDLEKHVSTVHLLVRAYMCETCGHKSNHQGALNRHKISHSGEKPYKCTICDQAYGHADKLKNHLQRHVNDEKPFVCHLCGHAFWRRDNLQMHLKRIHKTTLDYEVVHLQGSAGQSKLKISCTVDEQ